MTDQIYAEFSDPRLVPLYDVFNSLDADRDEKFFLDLVAKLGAKSIVDLGCGTGLLTIELAKRGFEMTGVEPAAAMLDLARVKPFAEKVTWIEGGSEKMVGMQTDLVLMTSHVSQFFLEDAAWEKALADMYAALKPGGYLVFDSRNPLNTSMKKWSREKSTRWKDTPSGPVEMWVELLETNGNRVKYTIHYLFKNSGEELISANELIFRSESGLRASLMAAGFSTETIYGDWDGTLANQSTPEMIFVAKK